MSRLSRLKSLFAFVLVLTLVMGAGLPTVAQDEQPAQGEETALPEQVDETRYGLLQISAVTCPGDAAGGVSILLAPEFGASGDCVDGSSALLIDGVDQGVVAPYLEIQLEAGFHTLTEPNSGAARDIEIVADGVTAVVIVTSTTAAEPTGEAAVEPASEPVSSDLLFVAHACKPDVQSVDQLYALGGLTDRLNACPAFTLPGFPAPGGAVTGGELAFDFTLAPATGDAQTLTGNGAFLPDALCESAVGPLDNDPTNDRCVSTSGFSFQLPEGSITLTQTLIPDTMRYVAAETDSDADAGIITGSDPGAGYLGLDTSLRGTDQPVVHLYYLNPPRVNVLVHLCGPEIASPDDLAALGGVAAQLLTCPAVARVAEGGPVDFGVTVTDNTWGPRGLDAALFDPTVICEAELGDWNGDGSDNACVDAPTYRFDQTAMGYVTVAHDFLPAGYAFAGAASDDSGVISGVDLVSGVVTLDTSYDGDVTIHLFDIPASPPATETPTATPTKTPVSPTVTRTPTRTPAPPSPTSTATSPAATRTPTSASAMMTPSATAPPGTGTLIVAAFYCLSGSGTSIVALPPGAQASASDMGGADCFSGDATISLTLVDGSTISLLKLGRDGVEAIQNIPVTGGGSHTITEGLTGQSATFEIAGGTITRVIIRYGAGTAMVDEGVAPAGSTAGGGSGTNGGPTSSTGGLVTDELIGDAGVSSSDGSYAGISFTSLVIDDVDAEAVSSVKDAKSLPAVGVLPVDPMQQYVALAGVLALVLASVALAARRSTRRVP